MASKKTVGKRQRDRLKKAQAKREATATGTAANPTSSHATSSNTMASSGSTPRVQELDPSTYHDVEFVTYAMGLGACVTEAVTVDHRGRKLRVMMGAEPVSRSTQRSSLSGQSLSSSLFCLKQRN